MVKDGIFLGKRYEILEKIGAGGMADVYKGKDHMLNRYVAIKVLKKEFRKMKHLSGNSGPRHRQRQDFSIQYCNVMM